MKLDDGRGAFLHCPNGRGRTGLIAAAWLLAHERAENPDGAVARVRSARPGVRLLPRQRNVVEGFAAAQRAGRT